MDFRLNAIEARIIGALIEKQVSTPDQYPLTLNSLLIACNQKSNRDPVMELDETDVLLVIDELKGRRLAHEESGQRVPRFIHRFCNTEFGQLKFSPPELAILAELLLRGPQTPGELRSRCARMHAFQQVTEVDKALAALIEKGPYVEKLPREAGKRENRFVHLFQDDEAIKPLRTAFPRKPSPMGSTTDLALRVQALEEQVERLTQQLETLVGPL